jgi:hypothetical protein
MERVRSTFAIDGFTAAEAAEEIPHLQAELEKFNLLTPFTGMRRPSKLR